MEVLLSRLLKLNEAVFAELCLARCLTTVLTQATPSGPPQLDRKGSLEPCKPVSWPESKTLE